MYNPITEIIKGIDGTKETHLIFVYKGKVYSRLKYWSFERCEAVLNRIKSSYWELG